MTRTFALALLYGVVVGGVLVECSASWRVERLNASNVALRDSIEVLQIKNDRMEDRLNPKHEYSVMVRGMLLIHSVDGATPDTTFFVDYGRTYP